MVAPHAQRQTKEYVKYVHPAVHANVIFVPTIGTFVSLGVHLFDGKGETLASFESRSPPKEDDVLGRNIGRGL